MRKIRAMVVIAFLWGALWALGALLAYGAWFAAPGDPGPGVWSTRVIAGVLTAGVVGTVAGAGFAVWHWRAGRRRAAVRWTVGQGAWAGALGAGVPTLAALALLYAIGLATGHPRPGEPRFTVATHVQWVGVVVAWVAACGALAGAATYRLAAWEGERAEQAPGMLPPNGALQLTGMQGRPAEPTGTNVGERRPAPKARS